MGRPKKAKAQTKVAGTRAVIYLRVSTDEQVKHGYGLDDQVDVCKSYCTHKGYTIVSIVRDEGISGTCGLAERAGLATAIELCESRQADVLIAAATDRLSRDVGLFVQLRDRLIVAGVRFEPVKEGQDLTTANSMLMGDIFAAFAAEERRRIAARLLGGRKERSKRDGRGSGPIPYGYQLVNGAIIIDTHAVPVIAEVLRLRKRGMTYREAAESLNCQGYRTKTGKEWTSATVQGVERHEELYRTGRRVWDTTEAQLTWPILVWRPKPSI